MNTVPYSTHFPDDALVALVVVHILTGSFQRPSTKSTTYSAYLTD